MVLATIGRVEGSLASGFASLFTPLPRYTPRRRWELFWLIAILLVAAVVRLWDLGSFSLHKPDEDTTVLAAVHIFQGGLPRFPDGMFYARAVAQSYLIAASVAVFGQNEWALRLPSVLSGLTLVLLAYFLGRRFLVSVWNMIFVAVVALLPGLIADSQEARMYIFLSASLAAYMVLLFRWERTGRTSDLLATVVAMLVAIQFQEIAVFAALLIFYPGLVHGDRGKLRAGLVAFILMGVAYLMISRWILSFYPHIQIARDVKVALQFGEAPSLPVMRLPPLLLVLAGAALVAAFISWQLTRTVSGRAISVWVAALAFIGLMLDATLHYHLGLLMLVAAMILARRNSEASGTGVVLVVAVSLVLAAAQVVMLHVAAAGPVNKIIGLMAGKPSIWPLLQLGRYSPIAFAAVWVGAATALWHLAQRKPIADYWLFFLLGLWLPLIAMGTFGWFFPTRYTEFALLPLLLCGLAALQSLASRLMQPSGNPAAMTGRGALAAIIATVSGLAVLNPIAVAGAVDARHAFPDHRAAAQFMRSLPLGPRDIIVAEEALMQTYYLGHIDYWLEDARVAAEFVLPVNGQIVDEYTHTPLIGNTAQLNALLLRPDRGAIYIVGSGENQEDGRLAMRGPGLSAMLGTKPFKVIYVAPDGVTKIWKIDAPSGGRGAGA